MLYQKLRSSTTSRRNRVVNLLKFRVPRKIISAREIKPATNQRGGDIRKRAQEETARNHNRHQ